LIPDIYPLISRKPKQLHYDNAVIYNISIPLSIVSFSFCPVGDFESIVSGFRSLTLFDLKLSLIPIN
jgi:hypothetical protein